MRHTFGLKHHALVKKISSAFLLSLSIFISSVFAQTETAPLVAAASSVANSSVARESVQASSVIVEQSY